MPAALDDVENHFCLVHAHRSCSMVVPSLAVSGNETSSGFSSHPSIFTQVWIESSTDLNFDELGGVFALTVERNKGVRSAMKVDNGTARFGLAFSIAIVPATGDGGNSIRKFGSEAIAHHAAIGYTRGIDPLGIHLDHATQIIQQNRANEGHVVGLIF